MMKNILFLLAVFALSCSGFNIKKTLVEDDALSALKASGVIIRVWKNSAISVADIESNTRYWLDEAKKNNPLSFIPADELSYYNNSDRFYQTSEGKFLKYKSSGALKVFLTEHMEELSGLIKNNNLDSLIFYEADGFFTPELQSAYINSVLTIVDRDLNVLYMDNYSKNMELGEWDRDAVKKTVLDQLSRRFVYSMESLNYVKK